MWKLFIISGLHSCLVCVLNFLFKCCVQSSCEPIWQYTLWNDGMCVCSSVACTSLCTCMHSAMAGSILRWSCQLTRSWHPISMLLMIPDRLEPTLQIPSLHVGMCDCSSASEVLSTWAIRGNDSLRQPFRVFCLTCRFCLLSLGHGAYVMRCHTRLISLTGSSI